MSPRSLALPIALLVSALPLGGCSSDSAPPAEGSVRDSRGFRIVTIPLDDGQVVVLLPDDLAAGDTISGQFEASTSGPFLDALSALRERVAEHSLGAGGEIARIADGHLTFTIPSGVSDFGLDFRDATGALLSTTRVPVGDAVPATDGTDCALPAYFPTFDLFTIHGRFDGDSRNTRVSAHGEDLEVWVESPRRLVLRGPRGVGRTELRVSDGDWSCRREADALEVIVEPRQTRAGMNESVPVTIRVRGLDLLPQEFHPTVDLTSWSDGQEATEASFPIDVAAAVDGEFSFIYPRRAVTDGRIQAFARLRTEASPTRGPVESFR